MQREPRVAPVYATPAQMQRHRMHAKSTASLRNKHSTLLVSPSFDHMTHAVLQIRTRRGSASRKLLEIAVSFGYSSDQSAKPDRAQTQNRPKMALSDSVFSQCVAADWHLSIGDPNVLGWTLFAAYALAAGLAGMVLYTSPFAPAHRWREQLLWALIAGLMAGIALNKQLDLQTLILTAGRCLAKEQGWYEDRRLVQRDFILALVGFAALIGGGTIWLLRGIVRSNLMALLGLAILTAFVVIRGGHLFHIFEPEQELADYLVHLLTSVLEALSPVLIILAAWISWRKGRFIGELQALSAKTR